MTTLRWLLDVNSPNAAKTFEDIKLRMDKLDESLKKTREISVGDRSAMATFAKLQLQADRFKDKLHGMDLTIDGAGRAEAQLLGLEATADRLNDKLSNIGAGVHRSFLSRFGPFAGGGDRGFFGRLLLGGQGKGPGGEAAGSGLLGLLGAGLTAGGATPYLYGAGALLAATLAPAAIPLGLAGLAGGGATLGAFSIGKTALKQLQALNKQLASATKPAQRRQIREQIAALQQSSGPELSIASAFSDLGIQAKTTFGQALKSPGAGFSAGPHGQPGAPSFLTSLEGILRQVAGFIKSIGPELGDLFRASIPYLRTFVGFMEQAAKVLLPVFVQMLQEMRPFLPLIAKGLMNIVGGLAGFLKAIGPAGMQASAKIFVFDTKIMAAVLVALGHAINWLTENVPKWTHDIAAAWDKMFRAVSAGFEMWRHDWAHTWDVVFNNTIGRVIRGGHGIEREWNTWTHNIGVIFDGFRHGVAHAWDLIWNNTVARVRSGVGDVVSWFEGLPGKAINALEGLGTDLYNFAHMAMTKLWNGLKSVFTSVWSWFKSLPGKLLNAIGIHSPPDWAIEAGKHIMGGILHGITSRKAELQNAFASSVKFRPGAGVAQWAGLVRRALAMEGLSPRLLGNVLYQMQTESGGNPNAINLNDINARMGDPSRGLMQTIMSTFQAYHWPGTSWNIYDPLANIAAALNYARHVYGPSLMSGGMGIGSGHGYALGGLITEPIFGVGMSGRTYTFGERGVERVTPGSGPARSGALVNVQTMVVQDATDAALVAQQLSFRVIAAGLS